MLAMYLVVGFLMTVFAAGLVLAEIVDRRRSIEIDSDPTRFTPRVLGPLAPVPVRFL